MNPLWKSRTLCFVLGIILVMAVFGVTNDGLLASDDDLLAGDEAMVVEPPKPAKKAEPGKEEVAAAVDPHLKLYSEDQFPSATQCATCHQTIYDEWRISSHAYASISPMFHKFEQRISDLTQGTIANFCVRCHVSVGTTLGEPREAAIWDRAKVSREGITCVTCHRVKEEFAKVNGMRRIEPGEIYDPVYSTGDGKNLKEVIANKSFHKVAPSKKDFGSPIHQAAITYETLGASEFCVGCHQVAVHPGIKLEVVWDQYRASPSLKKGTTCQDCHMGKVPGQAEGYATGHVAVVNGQPIGKKRRRSNHTFYGPGYPIAHPGIFPHHPRASNFEVKDWLEFDYRADWGKPDFERKVANGSIKVKFPDAWADEEDRKEARSIVSENIALLEKKKKLRQEVMENGSHIDGPYISGDLKVGETLKFHYVVTNTNPGHNLPSGSLGAQPEIWMNVVLTDPNGKRVWESGYVDSYGDMADVHSEDVHKGILPFDNQLVNFQTKFLTQSIKGTDREMFLPVNFDVDQRPFIRPPNAPNTILNHPAGVRMEARSIPPLGSRKAKYSVPGDLLKAKGKYKLSVRMRSRAEPIYFMKFVGATQEMIQAMNEWMVDLHPYTVEFELQ